MKKNSFNADNGLKCLVSVLSAVPATVKCLTLKKPWSTSFGSFQYSAVTSMMTDGMKKTLQKKFLKISKKQMDKNFGSCQ